MFFARQSFRPSVPIVFNCGGNVTEEITHSRIARPEFSMPTGARMGGGEVAGFRTRNPIYAAVNFETGVSIEYNNAYTVGISRETHYYIHTRTRVVPRAFE